jgi:adenylate kinase
VSELNLILLGPPGAGKGTQGRRLEGDFGLPYIVTGDILREAKREGTDLGRKAAEYMDSGELVPDEVIIDVILARIAEDDCRDGFILDGFPRTLAQAEALDSQLEDRDLQLTAALMFQAPDETVLKRISGRRCCVKAGHVYNVHFDKPKHEGVCDQDGSRLEQRDDDAEDKVKRRLEIYHEQTEPLGDYFEQRGILRRFDGSRDAAEVHDHVRASLATLRMEEQL